MTMPLAAAVLAMATTPPTRCASNDVRDCATSGTEGLVTVVAGPNVGTDMMGGFGPPSSALSLTFMKHRVPAWADLAGSELRHPQPEIDGIPTFMPSAQLSAGSEIAFHCPRSTADVCDAWVFFYSCQQSCTVAYQGGVPGQLAADGWQHTICAPRFLTGVPSGYSHQMRSYRMKVQPGDTARFTTAATAEFLAFGLDMDGVTCSKYGDEPTCTAAPNAACVWSPMGECLPTSCRRGGKGPPPPCTECPWQGIVRRPAGDGPF